MSCSFAVNRSIPLIPSTFFFVFVFAATCCHAAKPNIVIILADDMGYGDPGCYNPNSKIATPHIDSLATGGMRFTDAHTPSSVCTPTRYTLLTGRYCWRTRLKSGVLDGFSPPLIEASRETIASFLRSQGYRTACIGKWHLGMQWTRKNGTLEDQDRGQERGFRPGNDIDFEKPITSGPLTVGFDSYFGISASLDMPPYCWIENDRCVPKPNTTVPTNRDTIFLNQTGGVANNEFSVEAVLPELKHRSVQWIKQQHRETPQRPFFLYLPLNSPHLPVAASKPFQGKSQVGHYGDFMMETDDLVGAVLAALQETGDEENTLVLFTSDNGGLWHGWRPQETDDLKLYAPTPRARYTMQFGHHSNGQLRGTKADIWEGGHRVPFLVKWPQQVPAGTVSGTPVELTDVFSTIADIVEVQPKSLSAPDSFSFRSVLTSPADGQSKRPFLIHHSLRGMFAIRQDEWKYVEARGSGGFTRPHRIEERAGEPATQLYNLKADPGETTNRTLVEEGTAGRLAALLQEAKLGTALRPLIQQ